MAEQDDKAAGAPEAAAPAKKGKPVLLIVIPLLSAVAGAGVTFLLPKSHATKDEKVAEVAKPATIEYFAISDVKANLARSGGTHFCGLDLRIGFKTKQIDAVRARLGLKPPDSKDGAIQPLGGALGSAARDRIIMLLAAKSMQDLEGRAQKDLLKKEIQSELQAVVFPDDDATIGDVLFNDFLLQ